MLSMQNLGSTTAGSLAALGSAGCLYQAGNAVNNAIQDGGSNTPVQKGLDSLLGEATNKTSHVARNVFEATVWTAGAVVLGGVVANSFDSFPSDSLSLSDPSGPQGNQTKVGGNQTKVGGNQTFYESFTTSAQEFSDASGLLNTLYEGASSLAQTVYDSTLGAFDSQLCGGLLGIADNPLTGAGVTLVTLPIAHNRRAIGGTIAGAAGTIKGLGLGAFASLSARLGTVPTVKD